MSGPHWPGVYRPLMTPLCSPGSLAGPAVHLISGPHPASAGPTPDVRDPGPDITGDNTEITIVMMSNEQDDCPDDMRDA